jgi:hypothetical protein
MKAAGHAWWLAPAVVLAIGACQTVSERPPGGLWRLSIDDLTRHERAVARIRLTDESAPSCMGGEWKRVVVESVGKGDDKFFPLSEPLSYEMEGPEIVIGRNEVCDGYLHLRGMLEDGKAHGRYSAFGKGGGEPLGDFTLERLQR